MNAVSRIFTASLGGAVIGSALVGIWTALWAIFNLKHSIDGHTALSDLIMMAMLGMIFSFIPVLLVTSVVGPLATRLSQKNGFVDTKRYFAAVTAIITVPWLFLGQYGIFASALMLLSYGYPTAYIYLRFANGSLGGDHHRKLPAH